MVGGIAYACCVEFKVDIGLSSLTLHKEFDTTILVNIITIPWGECTKVLSIDNVGDV